MHHGFPDSPHNTTNGILCLSCHNFSSPDPKFIPVDPDEGSTIDETRYNSLCWSCHYSGSDAPYVKTHSSLNTSDRYGNWTVECWVCHNQHKQEQIELYPADTLLYSGTTDAVTETTITDNEAGWPPDGLVGMRVVPDRGDDTLRHWNYRIVSNTATTLEIEGVIDTEEVVTPEYIAAGKEYGIYLGKLMPYYINLGWITDPGEPKSGRKYPKLFRQEGVNSFADGGSVYDGICEVCHTMTSHFRNDGTGEDQEHANLSESVVGTNCLRCHSHANGFAHSGGPGTGCVDCHGHDAGSNFDPDMSEADGGVELTGTDHPGYGSAQSHSTHTETTGDDLKGPGVYCDSCHNINSFPYFKTGSDANGDGLFSLNETDVCDACHSKGGTYDGIDDPVIGAKQIWKSGAYVSTSNSTLRGGKEKWCAGCHDESASVIAGVTAPNVVGDEDGPYAYGTGWGYYKTGHGLARDVYPASGAPGANQPCSGCHDFAVAHVDGTQRTYLAASDNYQAGYRLKSVSGQPPMDIPRTDGDMPASDFALCFSCHNSALYLTSSDMTTNFRDADTNAHHYHLQGTGSFASRWDSDWDGSTGDSKASCPSCHNVHGSPSPRMVRHGELISSPGTTDKVPSLELKYTPTASSPTLMNSTGGMTRFIASGAGTVAKNGVCNMCHNDSYTYIRTPNDIYPPVIWKVYGRVGSTAVAVMFSEGVYTNSGAAGDLEAGDFVLTDTDNGRSITGVAHNAGDNYAILTLSSALDSVEDLDVDTLAAATATSIYDSAGSPMGTVAVTVEGDSIPPALENMSPGNGTTGVSIVSNVTFTLSDSDSGIDWTSLSVTLSGTGYNESYSEADAGIVSGTGSFSSYNVTVNPAVDFPYSTVIAVTVDVYDVAGNQLPPSSWLFTTEDEPIPVTQTLHPAGLSTVLGDGTITANGGGWADILDTNDGDASHVYLSSHFDGGGPTFGQHPAGFKVAMDDALGMSTISEVRAYFTFRYSSPGGGPPATYDKITLIIDTGGASEITQEYHYTGNGGVPSYTAISLSSTTDPDGGPWELADIQNLRAGFKLETRENVGWITTQGWVTEVYVEVAP